MKNLQFTKLFVEPLTGNRPLAIVVIAATGLFAVTNVVHLLFMSCDGVPSPWDYSLDLLNSLLINVLAAYLLYVLVVHLPGLRRRSIIRSNLATHYRHFREDLVANFLQLANERADLNRIQELRDMRTRFESSSVRTRMSDGMP